MISIFLFVYGVFIGIEFDVMFHFLCATDKVFGPSCANQKVYEEGAKDVALSALKGMNGNRMLSPRSGRTFLTNLRI